MLRHFKFLREHGLQLVLDLINDPDVDQSLIDRSSIKKDALALRDGVCKIAVVAPFSAGKSTFLNALLGMDLLSTSMLAETAIITRIRYGAVARLTILYRGGHGQESVQIPGAGPTSGDMKELVRLFTTVVRTPAQEAQLREQLRLYASAPGTTIEEKIQEVIIEGPFRLCEEGVELIDTPGLFARHPGHQTITGQIMPEADAILFLLEPDKLGEANFTQIIRTHVEEARQSNLEEAGRHLFFLINKLDLYPTQYDVAVREVRRTLEGILPDPQILGVSSYLALAARRYRNGEIGLAELQRDRCISIPDPQEPDFPLAGRALREEHVVQIERASRMEEVEERLGWYLTNRRRWLIENLARTASDIYRKAADEAASALEVLRHGLSDTQEGYRLRIQDAKGQMERLEVDLSLQVDRLIYQFLTNKNNGLTQKVEACFEHAHRYAQGRLEMVMREAWQAHRKTITAENGMALFMQVTELGEQHAQILTKEATRDAFGVVNHAVESLTLFLRQEFTRYKIDLDRILQELGLSQSAPAEALNLDNLANTIRAEIEGLFRTQVQVVAGAIQSKVREVEVQHTHEQLRGGIWNWLRGQIGLGHTEQIFDAKGFYCELDSVITELATSHASYVGAALDSVVSMMLSRVGEIAQSVKEQAEQVIAFELQGHGAHLDELMQELSVNTADMNYFIHARQETRRRLLHAADGVRRFQEELAQGVA